MYSCHIQLLHKLRTAAIDTLVGVGALAPRLNLQQEYWASSWNRLDMVVVISSWLTISGAFANMQALRLLRTLKPLRTLKALPRLRMLISVCLQLGHEMLSMVLLLLIFIMWSTTLVLPVWKGSRNQATLTWRCADPALGEAGAQLSALANANSTVERLCSANDHSGRSCEEGLACMDSGMNPLYGYRHFEHFGAGFITLLQVVTLDGWSVIQYQLQDATNDTVIFFFTAFVLCTSFGITLLFLNVIVVRVAQQIKEADNKHQSRPRKDAESSAAARLERMAKLVEWGSDHVVVNKVIRPPGRLKRVFGTGVGFVMERWKALVASLRREERVYPLAGPDPHTQRMRYWLWRFVSYPRKTVERSSLREKTLDPSIKKEQSRASYFDQVRRTRRPVLHTSPVSPAPAPLACQFFLGLIILSGLLLCGTYEGMSTEVSKTLDQMNTALVYLFALECVLKLVAFGPLRFFCDNFNIFDTVVVLAGLPNLFLDGLSLGFIRIMRLFRIVRSVKVLRKIKSVRMTIRGLQLGLPDTGSYLLLFTLFVYIATLAGMQLFGGLFGDNPPDSNFDSLSRAAISSLQLITCAGWADIYFSGQRFGQGVASNIVLLPLMILGRFFLVQLLTAVLIARLPLVPLIKRSDNARIQLRLMHEKKVRALEHFKSIQRGGAFAMAAGGGEHESEETSERGGHMAEDDDDSPNSSPASKRSSTGTYLTPTSERVPQQGSKLAPKLPLPQPPRSLPPRLSAVAPALPPAPTCPSQPFSPPRQPPSLLPLASQWPRPLPLPRPLPPLPLRPPRPLPLRPPPPRCLQLPSPPPSPPPARSKSSPPERKAGAPRCHEYRTP